MGFYDGLGGTTEASAWEVADTLLIPAVLVVRPGGSSITLAAQIRGLMGFRSPSHIAGLLLTDCKPMLFTHLRPILERETRCWGICRPWRRRTFHPGIWDW